MGGEGMHQEDLHKSFWSLHPPRGQSPRQLQELLPRVRSHPRLQCSPLPPGDGDGDVCVVIVMCVVIAMCVSCTKEAGQHI